MDRHGKCVSGGWGILLAAMFSLSTALTAAESNPARWEKDIQKFEAADKAEPPPKGAVLFTGSSSIRLWPALAEDFPELQVIQRGFGGSQMEDLLYYADRIILPYKPSKVVIYEGDNDIADGKEPAHVARQFEKLVKKIHADLPQTEIYYITIKPSPSRWKLAQPSRAANALIEGYAERTPRVEYIDIWTPMLDKEGQPRPELFVEDMLHMNKKGYAIWVETLKPHLAASRE